MGAGGGGEREANVVTMVSPGPWPGDWAMFAELSEGNSYLAMI